MAHKTWEVRVGTSGWYYDHWSKRFYPEELSKKEWFEYYASHFDTVEVNNTYYHLPKEKSVKRWHDLAPENFLYTVKANRFITHVKKLKDAAEPLENFLDAIEPLAEFLGPILYQLPPSLHKDLPRLEDFIEILPPKIMAVFEFRHNTWFTDDVFDLLDRSGVGFCIHDLGNCDVPRVITANLIYLRFHDPPGEYHHSYPSSILEELADWAKENRAKAPRVFAYFNNDYNAYAVENAIKLRELLVSE
jgi:uncharacterized protein YecE (DUF72 family)